jgi:hypothetical protein
MRATKQRHLVFKPKGTVYTSVEFQDQGQDFITWDIEESTGEVFKVHPFQEWLWCGVIVNLEELVVGETLTYTRDEARRSIRYPIKSIVGGRIL